MVAARRPLELAIGERCQDRCVFCSDLPDIDVEVPAERLLGRMREARALGASALELSGLEPTLRGDFVELVRAARELGYARVLVITNGRRFSDAAFATACVAAGLTNAIVSIHGHTSDLESEIVGAPDSFEEKVAGIRNLAPIAAVEANTVVTTANVPRLADVARFLATLGLVRWNVYAARPFGWGIRNFAAAIPPLGTAGAAAVGAARQARAAGLRAFVCDFPPCVLGDGADLAGMPSDKEVVAVLKSGKEQALEGLTKKARHKTKGDVCRSCRVEPRCEGVYREYVARRGWNEIHAIA